MLQYLDEDEIQPPKPLSSMTASEYYTCCFICYRAMGLTINEDAAPKDHYRRYADGRNGNLEDVPPDDANAFRKWANVHNKTIRKQSDQISQTAGRMDGMEQRKTYEQLVKANIEYDWFKDVFTLSPNEPQRPKGTIEELDDIVAIMVDCICTRAKTIRVGGQNMDAEVVRSQLLKLNNEHIQYVFERVYGYAGEIANIKAYMITVLYNAAITMNTAFNMDFRATFGC